jgi:type IV pilus assembly protein PilX
MNPMQSSRQKGVVLIVALIMLVVMTLLGLTSIRMVLQEERMAGNTFDRSLAFQAAEAALRDGEAAALAQSTLSVPNSGFPGGSGTYTDASVGSCPANYYTDKATYCNTNGLCKQPDPDCSPRWESNSFTDVWKDANVTLTATTGTPQYFIEYLGGAYPCDPTKPSSNLSCSRYRVTARSIADGRAAVILQSIYATE